LNSTAPVFSVPLFHRFKRRLGVPNSVDITRAISVEWARLDLSSQVVGKRIALGLGSRGITGLTTAAKTLVDLLHAAGAKPFIVPAMGSHGGATAEGQRDMLAGLGLTEAFLGCPIFSSMEVVDLGPSPEGLPLYCDALATHADGILLFNRIKAHTSFSGEVESGIHKMLAIGLGKEKAATFMHAQGPSGLSSQIPKVARALAAKLPFLAGFAVVEDAAHQPALIEALTPGNFADREPQLLAYAKSLAARLPVEALDVLIVDRMGKDISGTGMDTHVIGRLRIAGEPEPVSPRIDAIVALGLSQATHGNALGIGLADFTTAALAGQIDFTATARNVAATGNLERGRLPLVFPSASEAVTAAVKHVFRRNPGQAAHARILRIANTLELAEGLASAALADEMLKAPDLLDWGPAEPVIFE
jgi:hypothetical protein